MLVRANLSAFRRASWGELLTRFVLGGLATVVAGVIANMWGPTIGGLFLAFPAIFCASATLVEKHERKRKEAKGFEGDARGRKAAALEAVGSGLGGTALAALAAVVWLLSEGAGPGSLVVAASSWLFVASLLWLIRRRARVGGAG